ncbi:MAG: hypothetical protein HY739_07065 [Desulfobacterales bacterium]|nr:hypothetical protein [Desulfobacterales bacterium]
MREKTSYDENMLKTITSIFTIIGVIAGIAALGLPIILNPEPKTIDSYFSKCESSEGVIYLGELRNTEAGHAKDLKLSGALNAEIIDFQASLNNDEKKEYNKPRGTARLYIQRLPSGSKSTFYIIAAQNTDINEPFTLSWGDKGKALLKLQTCDEKTQKGIDIGSQLSKLARKARQTVVKRNDN